jgi:endonuclease/exonuclease/phosphatase family metal-dependent hydrolase
MMMRKRDFPKTSVFGKVTLGLTLAYAALGVALSLVLLSAVVSLSGCKTAKARTLTVLSWNAQALFDGTDDGIEYTDYRAKAGWNGDKYRSRITAVSKALERTVNGSAAGGYPDVAVFIELENETVLSDLAEAAPKAGYCAGYFAKRPGQALGTGVLSRYPVIKARSHGYSNNGTAIPRPVSEVWIEAEDARFVILVCHWKSKLGKPEETRERRRDAARLAARLYEDIHTENPGVPVLLAGDFNQTDDEFFEDDYPILLTRSRPLFDGSGEADDWGQPETPVFYTPWGNELAGGSYYYKGDWERIDHFFLSERFFDGAGWDMDGVSTLDGAPWTDGSGIPVPYNARTGSGLSDHLPLVITLKLTRT